MRQRIRDSSTTVQDRERQLSVTVGGHGELTGLVFHGEVYHDLAPAELADLIVKTVASAAAKARRKAVAGAGDLMSGLGQLDAAARSAGSMEELVESVVRQVTASDRRRNRRSVA
jgi:DNA-binding protein YbaB